jgi:cobalt/nickel transport system permease protein
MHIPDGFLSPTVWVTSGVLAAGAVALAAKKSQEHFDEKTVPLTGVVCAFIFAAQMINFPVMAGTSGHLLGGVLAAVLLGPWVGSLVLSLVLIVQCFIFQDGGVSVLGANILNMSVFGVGGGYLIFKAISSISTSKPMFLAAIAVASWISVILASGACAVELGLSGTYPLGLVLKAMFFVHSFIGVGEAIISTAVIASVLAVRNDLVTMYKAEAAS